MTTRTLSVHESPSLGPVLSAFLAAPWFVVAAGLVLLEAGASALTSRYTPSLFAATHLATIGFLAMTASAAMCQLLPVLSEHSVRAVSFVAPLVQAGFGFGALVLAAAFLAQEASLFVAAAIILGPATGIFLVPTAVALWSHTQHKTIFVMRYALMALVVALSLGLTMAISLAPGHTPAVFLFITHPVWAFVGFFILWAGVAWHVLPMFQGVRSWSHRLWMWVVPILLGLAAGVSWGLAATLSPDLVKVLLLGMAGIIGVSTVYILKRLFSRDRGRRDAMTYLWYTALASLLAACCISVFLVLGCAQSPRWPLVFGVLAILGAAVSFINGMLYKIVPFLIRLHVQQQLGRTSWLMQEVVSGRRMMTRFAIHLLALTTLLIAIFWRPVTPLAAAFWMGAGVALGFNLVLAASSYRRALRPLSLV